MRHLSQNVNHADAAPGAVQAPAWPPAGAAPDARVAPPALPPRRRRRAGWVRALLWLLFTVLMLSLIVGAAYAGYRIGELTTAVPVWDALWRRGYFDRPLDTGLPGDHYWVTGYWVDYDYTSVEAVQRYSPHLDQVIAFAYGFTPEGDVQGKDPLVLRGLVGSPKRVLLFANMTDGDWSVALVRQLLTDPEVRQRSHDGIIAKVEEYGAAGVQLDFEAVPKELRDELTSYVADLAEALHARGKTLSMAVPAKPADMPWNDWNGAFDYAALGEVLDYMYIMAYDEHYAGGPPGPVASLPWTESVIRYAISVMPSKKIVLGLPGYGYDWGPDGGRAYGTEHMQRRLAELGATIEWNAVVGENVATYGDEDAPHTVWFPDERSLAAKLALAEQYNLQGVALWRLGLEPREYWDALAVFNLTESTSAEADDPDGTSLDE